MAALEFVQTYLDDLLCITRASLDDHLEHLKVVLTRLQAAGMKINAPKLKICAEEMEYLGYNQRVHILDAKYEKADLQAIVSAIHISVLVNKRSYWRYSLNLKTFLMGH